jgi:hypothetical protein
MEMKDDIIGRLNEELVKKEGLVRAEVITSLPTLFPSPLH